MEPFNTTAYEFATYGEEQSLQEYMRYWRQAARSASKKRHFTDYGMLTSFAYPYPTWTMGIFTAIEGKRNKLKY